MTYNDIITPIRKTLYGEGDIIFTFLSAHHGRIEAIAKGIRKSTSRKRGNIEYGMFSSAQFAEGRNLDILTEANMIDYNTELLSSSGVRFIYNVLPIINKFATDESHSLKVFEVLKEIFVNFNEANPDLSEAKAKYELLDVQDSLPKWNICNMCRLEFDVINKYNPQTNIYICNNCARKVESKEIDLPRRVEDIDELNTEDQTVILNILNHQIKSIT